MHSLSFPSFVRVLDGGLATELERHGFQLEGPLWSARLLADAPEAIVRVHRNYLQAGADCLLTASYQASRLGFAPSAQAPALAAYALEHAVTLAQAALASYRAHTGSTRPVALAASLGPYGAALANGAEFHGRYGVPARTLVSFHAERIAVLAATACDLLAFETVPSLAEAEAIAEALAPYPRLRAWVSFTCRDAAHVAHGEPLAACARALAAAPQVVALGINCTAPGLVAPLLQQLRPATAKALVVYPNSGEQWDPAHRCWLGSNSVEQFSELAAQWYALGAQAVGGCCRTGPAHIQAVAAVAAQLRC